MELGATDGTSLGVFVGIRGSVLVTVGKSEGDEEGLSDG